jgi:hypothetical protein
MFENLQALAELAKAGYKPNDIKELLELNNLQPVPEQAKDVNDTKPEAENKPDPAEDSDPIAEIMKRNGD